MNTTNLVAFGVVLGISGVFAMFGKGAGSLYTPVLVLLGFGIGTAISTALFLNLVTAFVATVVFARHRLVDYRFSAAFLPGTIAGSLLGAVLSSRAPRELLLGIFAVFLVGAGILMVSSAKGDKQERQLRARSPRLWVLIVSFSFAVGVLSSLIGVGGGLVIFPFLVLYMRYPAQRAAGANALIVPVSSLVGAAGHFSAAHPDLHLWGLTAVAAAIGSAIGSYVTVKASPGFVKIALAFILWFFAGQITLSLAGGT